MSPRVVAFSVAFTGLFACHLFGNLAFSLSPWPIEQIFTLAFIVAWLTEGK